MAYDPTMLQRLMQGQAPAQPEMAPPGPSGPQFDPMSQGMAPRMGFIPGEKEGQLKRVPQGKGVRESLKERFHRLAAADDGMNKLEKMAILLLRQTPKAKGPDGQRRQKALEQYILDKAKAPAIIEIVLDALGIPEDEEGL